jgi:hypothetical protein
MPGQFHDPYGGRGNGQFNRKHFESEPLFPKCTRERGTKPRNGPLAIKVFSMKIDPVPMP